MRTDRIGLANGGALTYREETVGPRHDPYGRTTVERHGPDGMMWRLVDCAVLGRWLEGPRGERLAELLVCEEDRQKRRAFWDEVVRHTGQSPDFWESRVWALRDARKDEAWHELRAIDARLLSYAM